LFRFYPEVLKCNGRQVALYTQNIQWRLAAMTTTVLNNTRVLLNTELILDKAVCAVLGVAMFVIATMLGAFVRIPLPFTPVPLTFQTFFVLLSGAMLGKKYGALSQAAYMGLGMAGLGVFAGGAGFSYLMGPTGGYIIGFILASFLAGWMIRLKETAGLAWIFLSMLSGAAVILIMGGLWLVRILHISPAAACAIGVLPFIPGDIIKLSLASIVFYRIQARARKIYP
jgi:biotin transport system substrate-specific component